MLGPLRVSVDRKVFARYFFNNPYLPEKDCLQAFFEGIQRFSNEDMTSKGVCRSYPFGYKHIAYGIYIIIACNHTMDVFVNDKNEALFYAIYRGC